MNSGVVELVDDVLRLQEATRVAEANRDAAGVEANNVRRAYWERLEELTRVLDRHPVPVVFVRNGRAIIFPGLGGEPVIADIEVLS